MDQEKRNKHFNRFLSPPLPKDPAIVSQCGLYEMHSPGRVQRKPHQMVTPRNERASSKKTPKSDTTQREKILSTMYLSLKTLVQLKVMSLSLLDHLTLMQAKIL